MTETGKHSASIEQRRDVYIAICTCGWRGPRARVLREAEADAWHHQFGDGRVVVLDNARSTARSPSRAAKAGPEAPPPAADGDAEVVDRLVSRARELARSSAPHRPGVTRELQTMARGSTARLERARSTIVELLHKHDQASGGAADSQWLELHTAKRILDAAADWHTAPAL
ncbi:MAG TPA: hypothetical protein VKI64_02050 [Acidimicrobiales bacterium]|nr:hypothetical protein [Acidimicrobiales bacterium]